MMNQDKKKMAMLIVKKATPEKEESKESFVDKGEEEDTTPHGHESAMEDLIKCVHEEDVKGALEAWKHLLAMGSMSEEEEDSEEED